jgi:Transposase DDE domain
MDNHLEIEGMMPAVFDQFAEKAPLCVMTRITLESLFDDDRLNQLFESTAQRQYHRELFFSQVVELMMSVVLRADKSVLAAYRKRADSLNVSDEAVYQKLKCQELSVSEALVRDSAERVTPVIDALKGRHPSLLKGYRVRILDGNHLQASQRRIRELRQTWAKGLPGRALAVYEPEVDLVTDVLLTPDGHASERSLLDRVIPLVRRKDVWIADRNFHTQKFLLDLAAAQGTFVIRQHKTVPVQLLGKRRGRGRCETGRLYEQRALTTQGGRTVKMRRITIVLDQPTRDGDTEIHILTNLPSKDAAARKVAELYQKRWRIENRFYEVTQTLECEPNTLGYPKAALFAFCLAMMASNAVALLKASLRSVHDADAVANMSHHYMATDIVEPIAGMLIVLPSEEWEIFRRIAPTELAALLRKIASHVDPAYYRKAKRGPKKPVTRAFIRNGGHVSTHKLLLARK